MADELSEDDIGTALLGVGFCVFGIFIDNFGITNMKISLNKQQRSYEENPDMPRRAYWTQKRWLFGFSLFLGGNILNGVGLSFAPQSLFAAVGALGLVFNAINARLILKESFPRRTQFGTFLVVCGSLLAVFFGSHHTQDYDLESIGRRARSKTVIIYASINVILAIMTYMTILTLQRMQVQVDTGRRASFSESTVNRLTETLSLPEVRAKEKAHKRRHTALSFLYPWMGGVVGSYTIIMAKCAAELISASFGGNNQINKWQTWLIIVGVLTFGATQIHWVNRGLAKYNQLLVIPTFNVCYSLFSILGGGIFFGEFDGFGATEWSVFPLSMCITFSGIYFITTGKNAVTKPSSSDTRLGDVVDDKAAGLNLPAGFSQIEFSSLNAGGHGGLRAPRKSLSMSASDEDGEESKVGETESAATERDSLSVPVKSTSSRSAPSSTHSSSSFSGSPRHTSPSSKTQSFQQVADHDSDHESSFESSPFSHARSLSPVSNSRMTGDIKSQAAPHDDASTDQATSPSTSISSSGAATTSTSSPSVRPSGGERDFPEVSVRMPAPSRLSKESPRRKGGLSGFVARHLPGRYSPLDEASHSGTVLR